MSDRTILITGGSGKLGRVLVRHFLGQGDNVISTCRVAASCERQSAEFARYGDRLVAVEVDLVEPGAPIMLRNQMDDRGIRPDCLINNARNVDFLKLEDDGMVGRENFLNEFLLDVVVSYELTMAFASQEASRMRRVVNIGSMYGAVAANPSLYSDPQRQSPLHYGVAKAALSHLTKELAVRLSGRGIQVNCVAFGGVEGRVDESFKERYARLCPAGRMLSEDEVAGPVDMLLSDQCSGVTGHTLMVDGGWSIW